MLQLPTHTQEENDETLTDLFSTRNVGSSSGVNRHLEVNSLDCKGEYD